MKGEEKMQKLGWFVSVIIVCWHLYEASEAQSKSQYWHIGFSGFINSK